MNAPQKHIVKVPFEAVPDGIHWMSKAIVACRGNQTLQGMIVEAMLGKAPENPPRIVSAAEITKDGLVVAQVQFRGMADGEYEIAALCTADELVTRFRHLADHCRLTDDERRAMFFELRAWAAKDHRAEPSFLG